MSQNNVFQHQVVAGKIVTTDTGGTTYVVNVMNQGSQDNSRKRVQLKIGPTQAWFSPADLRELGWTLLHMANVLEDKVLAEPSESS